MMTINNQKFGSTGFQLRLRLYQDGETRYINVTKLLKGAVQKKHLNQKKQLFLFHNEKFMAKLETLQANFKMLSRMVVH